MPPLPDLLGRAVARPELVRSKEGGACLALALHCLMVQEGFVPLDGKGRPRPGSWVPPPDWNGRFEHEWIFSYSRPGAARHFRLHCALQAQTRRMFIHASESDPEGMLCKDNIQVMGLQLDNYVPDLSKCSQRSWDGVIANEHTLGSMFVEFVAAPLWQNADKLPEALGGSFGGSEAAGGSSSVLRSYAAAAARGARQLRGRLADPAVGVPVAVGVAALAAAAALVWLRHHSQTHATPS